MTIALGFYYDLEPASTSSGVDEYTNVRWSVTNCPARSPGCCRRHGSEAPQRERSFLRWLSLVLVERLVLEVELSPEPMSDERLV